MENNEEEKINIILDVHNSVIELGDDNNG